MDGQFCKPFDRIDDDETVMPSSKRCCVTPRVNILTARCDGCGLLIPRSHIITPLIKSIPFDLTYRLDEIRDELIGGSDPFVRKDRATSDVCRAMRYMDDQMEMIAGNKLREKEYNIQLKSIGNLKKTMCQTVDSMQLPEHDPIDVMNSKIEYDAMNTTASPDITSTDAFASGLIAALKMGIAYVIKSADSRRLEMRRYRQLFVNNFLSTEQYGESMLYFHTREWFNREYNCLFMEFINDAYEQIKNAMHIAEARLHLAMWIMYRADRLNYKISELRENYGKGACSVLEFDAVTCAFTTENITDRASS